MKRKKTREKRLHRNRHPGRGRCRICHWVGRKCRQGNRAERSAAIKQGHFEEVEGFRFFGDVYNDIGVSDRSRHGKDAKSNRHHAGTARRAAYREGTWAKRHQRGDD